MLMQHVSDQPLSGSLYTDSYELPRWSWEYTCLEYAKPNPGVLALVESIDLNVQVFKDIDLLRVYGNVGAHASLRIEKAAELDEYVTESLNAMCRIGIVIAVWSARLPEVARL